MAIFGGTVGLDAVKLMWSEIMYWCALDNQTTVAGTLQSIHSLISPDKSALIDKGAVRHDLTGELPAFNVFSWTE